MQELEATDACRPPTPAFLAGLVLTTLHALAGLALGVSLLAVGFGDQPELAALLASIEFGVPAFLLTFAGIMGVAYTALFGVQIFACATAAFGSRGGTWTLVVTSVLTALTSTFVSGPIALLAIVGALQVLDQSDPYPSDEEFYGRTRRTESET